MNSSSKILVTGADGFIGSHLTEMLVKKGFHVRALVQYNSFGNYGWLDNSEFIDNIEIVMGDIRDNYFVKSLVKNIDVIFHLAALIAIPYSYRASQSYIETNINGTLNILQASLDSNVSHIIHTSTSEVYGTAKYVPINENHPLQAQSPYSASKIGADAITLSYFKSFNLPITIARPFNTYGPRQSSRAVIPTIITQLLNGNRSLKLGSLNPTRDFNYVSDTCEGFLSLAKSKESIGQTLNIGSGKEISIEKLVNTISEIIGVKPEIKCENKRLRPKNSEVDRLLCDNTKIKQLTGFKPKVSLKEGLIKTIDWMKIKDNIIKYKPDIYNV